jgi:hypothetical protein
MESLTIVLFPLWIISIAMGVLAFLVPLFVLGIYRNTKETKEINQKILTELKKLTGSSDISDEDVEVREFNERQEISKETFKSDSEPEIGKHEVFINPDADEFAMIENEDEKKEVKLFNRR